MRDIEPEPDGARLPLKELRGVFLLAVDITVLRRPEQAAPFQNDNPKELLEPQIRRRQAGLQ